jgi:hypothetical protein
MQKNQTRPVTSNIRLAELIAALSLATDLGMGQPMEYAQSVCILSVRLGEALGLNESELREVYYLALLRHIGCNAETYRMADLFGDELALRTSVASVDSARSSQMIGIVIRSIQQANEGKSALQLARTIAQGLMGKFSANTYASPTLAEEKDEDEPVALPNQSPVWWKDSK